MLMSSPWLNRCSQLQRGGSRTLAAGERSQRTDRDRNRDAPDELSRPLSLELTYTTTQHVFKVSQVREDGVFRWVMRASFAPGCWIYFFFWLVMVIPLVCQRSGSCPPDRGTMLFWNVFVVLFLKLVETKAKQKWMNCAETSLCPFIEKIDFSHNYNEPVLSKDHLKSTNLLNKVVHTN